MAVGEPPQEMRRLVPVVVGDRRCVGVEAFGDRDRALAHRGLVLVRRPDVAEHPDQVEAEPVEHGRVGLSVDLDVVERLPDGGDLAGRASSSSSTASSSPAALRSTTNTGWIAMCRPNPWRDSSVVSESGEERHVVGHDLHHGVG